MNASTEVNLLVSLVNISNAHNKLVGYVDELILKQRDDKTEIDRLRIELNSLNEVLYNLNKTLTPSIIKSYKKKYASNKVNSKES